MSSDLDTALSDAAPLRTLRAETIAAAVEVGTAARRRRRRFAWRVGLGAAVLAVLVGGGATAWAQFYEPLDDQPDPGQTWAATGQWQIAYDGIHFECSVGYSSLIANASDEQSVAEARRYVQTLDVPALTATSTFKSELTAEEAEYRSPRQISGASMRDFYASAVVNGAMGHTLFTLVHADLARKGLPPLPDSTDEQTGGQCQVVGK